MADLNLFPKKSMAPEEITLHMTLLHDAANAPTLVEGNDVASIAYAGSTGKFTITLRHKYIALKAFHFDIQTATAVDLKVQLRAADVSGAKTVTYEFIAVATATNPPAAGANAVTLSVTLVLRNSTVKGG